MPYSFITSDSAITELAKRLGDPGAVFWTNTGPFSELGGYLVEALRTWNAYAWWWRDRETFQLTSGTPFYDLTSTSLPGLNPAAGIRPCTVTDQDLIGLAEYQLLEPYNVTGWSGTEMFTFDDLVQALQRRLNQFRVETGMVLTHETIGVSGASNGEVQLSDSIIDVERAYWIDALTGVGSPVWKGNLWAANAYSVGWNVSPGVPKVFDVLSVPPLALQLVPPPANQGTLDFLAVEAGPKLNPAAGATALGIPDDFAWVVRMGMQADLLGQDGPAREPERSQYCEQRWQDGCELARQFPSVLDAQINGVAASNLPSISQLDRQAPGWQSVPTGAQTPQFVGVAGSNLVAAYPIQSGTGPTSLTLDVVRNAIVPTAPTDLIQVGREILDVILDYAVHLAAWKMEGTEFMDTVPHYQRLVRLASQYNERLDASAFFLDPIAKQGLRQVIDVPRRSSDAMLATK